MSRSSLICSTVLIYLGALLVQQAKCALSMEKAVADLKDKLAHHQQEVSTVARILINIVIASKQLLKLLTLWFLYNGHVLSSTS